MPDNMRKLLLLISFCALIASSVAQTQNINKHAPRAALSYNAQKSEAGVIIYDTSFFIFDFNISNEEKREKEKEVLQNDRSFKKVELLDVNGTKDMMVIIHVETVNSKVLTEKIKNLLQTIGVYNVEYNGEIMPLEKFNF